MNHSQEEIALGGSSIVSVEYERTESAENDYPIYRVMAYGDVVATVGRINHAEWYGTTGSANLVNQSRHAVTTDLMRRKYSRPS